MAPVDGATFGLEVAVDVETFELSLDPVLGAASEARRATRRWLADSTMSRVLLDDLQLVISELVTNAVVHAGTRLRLVVHFDGRRVVTEVFDADARLPTPAASAMTSVDAVSCWSIGSAIGGVPNRSLTASESGRSCPWNDWTASTRPAEASAGADHPPAVTGTSNL